MQELFRKYLDNQCSPDEVKELLRFFNIDENETLLRELIIESLGEDLEESELENTWRSNAENVFSIIRKQQLAEKPPVVPFYNSSWFRVAAAVVLVAGSTFIYRLINQHKTTSRELASADTTALPVAPGSNRATLTLADGSRISLNNAAEGVLARQGAAEIVKTNNGELTYTSLPEKPTESFLNKVTTPRGGQYQLTLSDGTKIWLNAASSLEFPAAFSGRDRTVKLTGEAYFEVARNPSKPFNVTINGKADVEVLGTHFNITAYSDESSVSTSLLEGSVKVTGLATQVSKLIQPGQQAVINSRNQMEVNTVADINQAIAWKNGIFNFNNADLESVLKSLSRWYDVEIILEGPLPKKRFDGEIQRSLQLSQVLKLLEKNNIGFRMEGKKLIVIN